MGLYDTFVMDAPCNNCGTILKEWQTKQLDCMMMDYTTGDTVPTPRYGTVVALDRCGKCNHVTWARVKVKDYIVTGIEVVPTFGQWLQRVRDVDQTLDAVYEVKREAFWDAMDNLMEEYRKDITEDDDVGTAESYDLAWNIIVRKLFDWLPINVVRAFFKEAMDGKVK